MQRVRMSLPYFGSLGWDAEVVTIDPRYSGIVHDELLLQSVPNDIPVHHIQAFDKSWTSKIGLGSLALRSLPFYRKKVNQLLAGKHFDLVYFSTTEFPVCILGAGWKKRFGVPYVIDMQDPWHSDYYQDKPKNQRPRKYWFSYRLNKYLEPRAMKDAGGLISVSQSYIDDLKARYPVIKNIPAATITFGAFAPDLQIASDNLKRFKPLLDTGFISLVYIGRGGADMHNAVSVLFRALARGLEEEPALFKKLKVYFIGTSYAPAGQGKQTILPLAHEIGIANSIVEITDRISYYHTLATLQQADGLFIPGSDDPKYTASKIYPYLLTRKPLLAIFNPGSPAIDVLNEYGIENVYGYESSPEADNAIFQFLKKLAEKKMDAAHPNPEAEAKYAAENMARRQCELFNTVINGEN